VQLRLALLVVEVEVDAGKKADEPKAREVLRLGVQFFDLPTLVRRLIFVFNFKFGDWVDSFSGQV